MNNLAYIGILLLVIPGCSSTTSSEKQYIKADNKAMSSVSPKSVTKTISNKYERMKTKNLEQIQGVSIKEIETTLKLQTQYIVMDLLTQLGNRSNDKSIAFYPVNVELYTLAKEEVYKQKETAQIAYTKTLINAQLMQELLEFGFYVKDAMKGDIEAALVFESQVTEYNGNVVIRCKIKEASSQQALAMTTDSLPLSLFKFKKDGIWFSK